MPKTFQSQVTVKPIPYTVSWTLWCQLENFLLIMSSNWKAGEDIILVWVLKSICYQPVIPRSISSETAEWRFFLGKYWRCWCLTIWSAWHLPIFNEMDHESALTLICTLEQIKMHLDLSIASYLMVWVINHKMHPVGNSKEYHFIWHLITFWKLCHWMLRLLYLKD